MADYARTELLAETGWLAEHLDDANLVVVDCQEHRLYLRGHIPGAVSSPSYSDRLKDPYNPAFVMTPGQFAALMAELGVGDDDLVIAYDDNRSLFASRLWWVLNYYGHHRVKVLNGGWNKWVMEGHPVSIAKSKRQASPFTPRPQDGWVIAADEVRAGLGDSSFVALDTRSDGEYNGANLRTNRFGGHMAGAVHLEWLNNMVDDDTHVFKSADDLRAMYRGAGVTEDKRLIAPY